jgi:cobalamin biosynthesis protein CobD/CbiB
VADALIELLLPQPGILLVAVAADAAIGDPVYPLHPVRIIGRLLAALESSLRRLGADGYGGSVLLILPIPKTIAITTARQAAVSATNSSTPPP